MPGAEYGVAVFGKVLVANRGEIAIRVFRTLRELGIGTIAVYSEPDRNAVHVAYADEAYLIGGGPAAESYLNQTAVLDAAQRAGADAVHPGYGFLAENASFARACEERSLVWIGPPPEAIEAMGSKIEARVQVLADAHGNVIHLGERDCTIQRRHQKLVEETPSPAVDLALRERIGAIAVDAARAVGYRSAGTLEGLLTRDGEWYFLEMNTRIQVEHTVTELATGLDLVREQVLIAAGTPLSVRQEDVRITGHAIECRINAEDVGNGFLPAPGTITAYREPAGPGVRVDSGVVAGSEISALYDPMIAKLVVHGVDREHARRRMLRALDEVAIDGVKTLVAVPKAPLTHPCFVDGATCHGVVESEQLAEQAQQLSHATTVPVTSDGSLRARPTAAELDGRRFDVRVLEPEPPWVELAERRRARAGAHHAGGGRDAIVSPMQGTVLAVRVADGDSVTAGQV